MTGTITSAPAVVPGDLQNPKVEKAIEAFRTKFRRAKSDRISGSLTLRVNLKEGGAIDAQLNLDDKTLFQ